MATNINNILKGRAFPWILLVLVAGVSLWYIFAGKPSSPDHSALLEQMHKTNDSLERANDQLEIHQADSRKREDSLQQIINTNEIRISNIQREKIRLIEFYRAALNSGDVPALQKYFTDYFRDRGSEKE